MFPTSPKFRRKGKRFKRLFSEDTVGGWIWVAIGLWLIYRYEESGGCSPLYFLECGRPSLSAAIAFLVLGGILVILRAVFPKKMDPD